MEFQREVLTFGRGFRKKHGAAAPTTKEPRWRTIVFLANNLDSLKMIRFT
jgi:hypothetical protein